ncbi:MAG TPA: carboxypeptidase regulatory-like domain-containing protein [Candidatus Solibacter sp.]|nr:carboxypeptidase regulatory-like domain-containing protein [Candidatus Solibacter sp.]
MQHLSRCIALFALVLCASIHAQSTAGRLSGNVTDPAGAAVPAVRITAVNAETGQKVTGVSNGEGAFVLYPLPPGRYDITALKEGFATLSLEGVTIDVAQTITRNLRLQVGAITQSVSVETEVESVQTDSPSLAATIVRRQIEELPLNGRDFNQLVLLSAGAVDNATGGNNDFGSVALNGNRTYGNGYLVDGVPNTNSFQGTSAAPLSIDLIREFKVYSGVAPAEFGQGGAQVTVVTQTGTNQLHGNLFEYYRGTQLEARDPFNTTSSKSFLRNQFGGSIGGPVRHDRTFFFFNYEGNRQQQQATRFSSVPLDAMWSGDFSALLPLGIQLRDPLVSGRPNIPGNRLDQYLGGARVSKTAVALRPYFGSPTQAGIGNNQVTNVDQDTSANQFTIRGDQILPHNQNIGARYTQTRTSGFIPNFLGSPGVGREEPLENKNGSLSWTGVLSPKTVGEVRIGAMKFGDVTSYTAGSLPTAATLGIAGFGVTPAGIPPLPQISFSGTGAPTNIKLGDTASFGEAALSMIQNIYTLTGTVSRNMGSHSLKFGYELHRDDYNALQQSNAGGQISFSGSATSSNSTGYAFADFLMGVPSSTSQVPIKSKILLKQTEMAGFAQDDWRLGSRLTLSLGLRYELFLNPYEDRNRLAMFDINSGAVVVASDDGKLPTSQYLPAVVSKLTDASGNWRFPLLSDQQAGFNPRRLLKTQMNNWGPRIGFAWHPDSNTVVHSGYGIFYSRYPIQYLLQTVAVNPPFAGTFSYSQSIANGVPALTLAVPYSSSGTASVSPAGIQRDFALPNNQQWNFTVERVVGWKTVVSLGYVGNKGTHLFRSINANSPYLDPVTKAVVRKYSGVYGTSTINFRMSNGDSTYHAMNLEVRRRLYQHVMFQGNWTWAKGIDDVGQNVQSALLDVQNLGRDRANSDYVRRHSININGVYDLPFSRNAAPALRSVFGNWKLGAIWRFSTGRYLTPTFTSSGGLSNSRPDVVYGISPNLPRDQRTPQMWFNPAGFAIVPATDPITGLPRFGNAGRNTIVGPGSNYMDANLSKVIPLKGERRNLTLRVEAFNLLNHPNYANPALNISTATTVGTITSILRPMREVQFAARFAW